MSIIDEKKKIFGEIAALRSLNESFPKVSLNNSFPSINNSTNSIDFLSDLLKSLVGFEPMKNIMSNIITHNIENIELNIKETLKKELNKMISCGLNPSIPNSLLYSSNGVDIEIRKLDYLGLLMTNPNSDAGKLLYNDTLNELDSTDFNTFLYYVIQDDGFENNWGQFYQNNDILTLKFNSFGLNNNSLNIKASDFYSNNKKLVDLNNDFIDSIKLLETNKILNNIIDSLFGSISIDIKKSKKQLQKESEIDAILNKIINSNDINEIDDSYFTFSNDEKKVFDSIVDNRSKGVAIIEGSNKINSVIPINDLIKFNEDFLPTLTNNEKFNIVNNGLDVLANKSSEIIDSKDIYTVKLNFIDLIIKKLLTSIGNVLLSPKLILIYSLNHYIIYGESFNNVTDFMKKNKNFIKSVMNGVRDSIITLFLKEILKEINTLVSANIIESEIEKAKLKKAQINSLLGINSEVSNMINNLIKV